MMSPWFGSDLNMFRIASVYRFRVRYIPMVSFFMFCFAGTGNDLGPLMSDM